METSDGFAIFSDAQVGALRMFIASLALLPLTLRSIRKIKNRADFINLSLVGFCGNFFPAFLFTYAETELSSGYAGMLNSFTPIFTLIIGGVIFRQKLTPIHFIGVFIAFIGIVLLMLSGHNFSGEASWKYILAIVVATFLYAISLNTIKYRLAAFSSVEITSISFGILLIPGGLATFFTGTSAVFNSNPHVWEGLGFICILSIVGTAIALILFNRIIALSSTLFASSVTYLIPIVAVILGTTAGERINANQIGSMFVVLLGVFIANYWRLLFKAREKTLS